MVVFLCSVYTSNMSSYFNLLSYITQKRYLTKLNINGCTLQDPYAIEELLWSEDMSTGLCCVNCQIYSSVTFTHFIFSVVLGDLYD